MRGDPHSHAALHDAATQSPLHRRHQREEAGDTGRDEEGVGDGGEAAGYPSQMHGVEEEVGGNVILHGTACRENLSSGMRKKPGVADRRSIRHREPTVVGTGKGKVI